MADTETTARVLEVLHRAEDRARARATSDKEYIPFLRVRYIAKRTACSLHEVAVVLCDLVERGAVAVIAQTDERGQPDVGAVPIGKYTDLEWAKILEALRKIQQGLPEGHFYIYHSRPPKGESGVRPGRNGGR